MTCLVSSTFSEYQPWSKLLLNVGSVKMVKFLSSSEADKEVNSYLWKDKRVIL